jgi:hypothetical protein
MEAPPPGEGAAELATFTRSFTPIAFSQEADGVFSVHPIAESRYWNRDGTRITEVAGYRTDTGMVIDITSVTRFSPDVSYFLYFFSDRAPGRENRVTLEIKPVTDGAGGLAVLWTEGKEAPTPVGTVTVKGNTCRLALGLDELPSYLMAMSGGSPTMDLTACYFDPTAREYEEFSYTTLALADFPDISR